MDQCQPKQIRASTELRAMLYVVIVAIAFVVGMSIAADRQLNRIEAKIAAPAAYTIPAPADLTPFATSTPSLPRG